MENGIDTAKEVKQELSSEVECLKEIEAILGKYNCTLDVKFVKDKVLGKDVLAYDMIVSKKK